MRKSDCTTGRTLPVHVGEHTDDVGFFNHLKIPGGGIEQNLHADLVYHTRESLAGSKDTRKRTFGKYRLLCSAYGHVVPNIGACLLLAHAAQVVLHANALDGGLVLLQPEQLAKLRLTDENQGKERGGIHVVVEREAQFEQHRFAHFMCFVDDDA
jgi:hypothetical protein